MSGNTELLVKKNKQAFNQHFYLESVFISYQLITRGVKQVMFLEKLAVSHQKYKLNDAIKIIKPLYNQNPLFTKKLKKSIFKDICEFNNEFKMLSKELKYQLPEAKIKTTAKKGMDVFIKLNTDLVKLKSNKTKV